MFHINIEAAIEIYLICYLVGVLVTSYLYLIARPFSKTISIFMLLYLFQFIGAILIYNRATIGLFFSIIIANLFILLGSMMILYVIAGFTKQKVNKYFVMGIIIFYFIYVTVFTYVTFDTDARILLHIATNVAVLVYSFIMIISFKKDKPDFKEILSPIIFVAIINYFFRVYINITAADYGNDFLNYDVGAVAIMITGIINLTMIAGVLSIMNSLTGEELLESERSNKALLKNVPGFAYRCKYDEYWTMEFLSEGFRLITGYETDDVIKNNTISYEDIIHPDYREDVRIAWDRAVKNHANCITEYQIIQKDGTPVWVWEQGVGIYDSNGDCILLEGYIVNIDSRKQMEENLMYLSYRDHLTGLYNRRYIEEHFNRLMTSRNLPITIISIDMNGLKFINDSFGHDQGDRAIQFVADTLKKSLRNYELVARLSGDEFMIILEQASGVVAELVMKRVYKALSTFDGNFKVSLAAGYSTKSKMEDSLLDVRKEAENKMYKSKMYDKPSHRRQAVDAVLQVLFEKDETSQRHAKNVSQLAKELATYLGLSQNDINKAETAGLLHDVGKTTIDVSILRSKGTLTKEEYEIIKSHPSTGYRIINSVPDLVDIAEVILYHHERPDGRGYPAGLMNKDIPEISKIISVCDAYDSMTSKQYYRTPLSQDDAIKELEDNAGTQFDRDLVKQFIDLIKTKNIPS